MGSVDEGIIKTFVDSWNTQDENERQEAIGRSCAPDLVLVHPPGTLDGRDALLTYMREETARWDGGQVRVGEINTTDRYFLYAWRITLPDGSVYGEGVHAGEVDDDGLVRHIVNFLGEAPSIG